jgi:hypothetical protein
MKEDQVGRACRTYGRYEKYIHTFKCKTYGVDGDILLKWILKKQGVRMWTGYS